MPRKRTLGPSVTNRMTALAVVRPHVERLGPMVERATFLEMMAARSSPERRPSFRREASLLAEEARQDLALLDEELARLGPAIGSQTQVSDARRALEAVAERFERTRLVL